MRAASPRPMRFWSLRPGSAWSLKIVSSLKTLHWGLKPPQRQAWPLCAFPPPWNGAREPWPDGKRMLWESASLESPMQSAATEVLPEPRVQTASRDSLVLIGITSAFALAHIITDGQYGFHRDELQFLSDARHLDWGFVAYPPMTPFIEGIGLALFGVSLVGLRLFSVIGQAVLIIVSGLMARDLGGERFAQITTALAVGLSPLPIFEATEFQYTSFAMLWWVLVCWFTIRLLKSDNPRWWLAIGAAIGLAFSPNIRSSFSSPACLLALSLPALGVICSARGSGLELASRSSSFFPIFSGSFTTTSSRITSSSAFISAMSAKDVLRATGASSSFSISISSPFPSRLRVSSLSSVT